MSVELKKALNGLKKECIRVTPEKPGFTDAQAIAVRLGGSAYAEAGDKAPICSGCGKPLSFIFQFRAAYDEKLKPSGPLLTVFYCFNCTPIGRPDEEKGQWLVKSHPAPDVAKFVAGIGVNKELVPCTCDLRKVSVLPDYETIEEKFPKIAALCEQIDPEDPVSAYEEIGLETGCEMEPFTSIGGYPIWIQGEGSQVCPVCKKAVELVAQIDSESGVNLMWGDAGCLYIFRCPEHKDAFAMEMQCF